MNNNRKVEAEKIVKEMNEDTDLRIAEELIKDNKISFNYDDKKYRVRLLNLKEKEELDMLRRKKFGQLIQDKDILLEKDLIVILKERGIDVDDIDNQLKKLSAEEVDIQMQLGESIAKNAGETILKNHEEKIKEIRLKKSILNAQKTLVLEFSLENQLLGYVSQVITYLSLEELKDGIWERMFKSLEDFQNYAEEKLINKAAQFSMILQYI